MGTSADRAETQPISFDAGKEAPLNVCLANS
jgi:hypothetical protein